MSPSSLSHIVRGNVLQQDASIGVLGGGVEGEQVVRYLMKHGFEQVTLYDERVDFDKDLPCKVTRGPDAFEQALEECDVVFRSPGIHPERVADLQKKVGKNVVVTSTIQFFLENCRGRTIGVTGTKGKGTTSSLMYEILKADGRDVYLGGNIGQSPLTFLDDVEPDSWTVLELSSFQLQDVTASPTIAVILMTTTEHLDYHADQAEYWAAKGGIAKFQDVDDVLIVNTDYEGGRFLADFGKGRKVLMGDDDDWPDYGIDPEKIALPGKHNYENVRAAVKAVEAVGDLSGKRVSMETVRNIVYSFAGLPHRLEFVAEVDGVKYYNDSFSTTPETSVAAAEAFSAPTIMMCGGSEKNADYGEWGRRLQGNAHVKMVVLMGVTAERMEQALRAGGGGAAGRFNGIGG